MVPELMPNEAQTDGNEKEQQDKWSADKIVSLHRFASQVSRDICSFHTELGNKDGRPASQIEIPGDPVVVGSNRRWYGSSILVNQRVRYKTRSPRVPSEPDGRQGDREMGRWGDFYRKLLPIQYSDFRPRMKMWPLAMTGDAKVWSSN